MGGMSQAPARRIYLHIGQHKTGTTWIQNVLYHNRARLAAAGVCYPDLGPCHGWPLVCLFVDPERFRRLGPHIGQRRFHSRPEQMRRNRETLADALTDSRWSKIVISGEQLCDMLKLDEVADLAKALRIEGVEVRVIFYAREPLAYAASMTQQRLKAGLTLKDLTQKPPTPDYRRRLQKFFRHFGKENVEIRVYDRARLKDGDVLADFMDAIGEPDLALDAPASLASNQSMSGLGARILDLRNRMMRAISPTLARRNPPWLMRGIWRLPGARFRLSDKVRKRLECDSAEDLAWLEKQLGYAPFVKRL